MTREEFCSLPPAIALGLVYDVASSRLRDLPKPRLPLPPKFDSKSFRKDGFVWCSEMALDDLRFWHERAQAGVAKGGQWADRDAKNAKSLGYWVKWRECYPDAVWTGDRERMKTTAKAPSRDAMVHPKEAKRDDAPRDYALDDETSEAIAEAEASQYDL